MIAFDNFYTVKNTNEYSTKCCHFNLTISPLKLVKLKIMQNG